MFSNRLSSGLWRLKDMQYIPYLTNPLYTMQRKREGESEISPSI